MLLAKRSGKWPIQFRLQIGQADAQISALLNWNRYAWIHFVSHKSIAQDSPANTIQESLQMIAILYCHRLLSPSWQPNKLFLIVHCSLSSQCFIQEPIHYIKEYWMSTRGPSVPSAALLCVYAQFRRVRRLRNFVSLQFITSTSYRRFILLLLSSLLPSFFCLTLLCAPRHPVLITKLKRLWTILCWVCVRVDASSNNGRRWHY